MHYKLYIKNPSSHYLYIDAVLENNTESEVKFNLSAWRPGRYELGNFAKNIKKFDAYNEKEELLFWQKEDKDTWVVQSNGAKSIKITYSYYSAELNAGSTFIDSEQMYVNPVNCLMFVVERTQEKQSVELVIPENYQLASSLKIEKNTLFANHFEELADSPFIASAMLQTFSFKVNEIPFYLHFNGECSPNQEKLTADFQKFIKEMLTFFGDHHLKEYHFIFQVLPHKFYHGVEHIANTVIAIGPGYHLMQGETYLDLLGVSCHELFHTWNVKTIRPIEMQPYHYTKENYSRLGFVYEGVTTYYGDKLLFTSDVFSEQQYIKTLEERINRHFHNYGRYNLSLADSSFDNWLDGYVPGAPYRKVSIYDEGNLVAFMLDILIMESTDNKKSLQHLMKQLYADFYKKGIGYSEQDIQSVAHFIAGKSLDDFFEKYVYGLEDYTPQLEYCLKYIGYELIVKPSEKHFENVFGFKVMEVNHYKKVTLVAPYSPAWKSGISANDEIIGVNGNVIKNDFDQLLHYFLLIHC
jgi:predicted metalloprotease with PDZ domain